MPDDKEVKALIAHITAAFQDVQRGEGVSLHETKVLDDYGGPAARQEARQWDTDTHWWEIKDKTIRHQHSYLGYLDDLGLRYYLPALMIYSLKHFNDPPDDKASIVDEILHVLTYWEQSEIEEFEKIWEKSRRRRGLPPRTARVSRHDLIRWRRQKWGILTTEQSRAIGCYLRYVAAHGDKWTARKAEKGLRQHWGQFCTDDT